MEGGVLGLRIPQFDWGIEDACFIKQLKEKELINQYNF